MCDEDFTPVIDMEVLVNHPDPPAPAGPHRGDVHIGQERTKRVQRVLHSLTFGNIELERADLMAEWGIKKRAFDYLLADAQAWFRKAAMRDAAKHLEVLLARIDKTLTEVAPRDRAQLLKLYANITGLNVQHVEVRQTNVLDAQLQAALIDAPAAAPACATRSQTVPDGSVIVPEPFVDSSPILGAHS